jgi:hypothetical protein
VRRNGGGVVVVHEIGRHLPRDRDECMEMTVKRPEGSLLSYTRDDLLGRVLPSPTFDLLEEKVDWAIVVTRFWRNLHI